MRIISTFNVSQIPCQEGHIGTHHLCIGLLLLFCSLTQSAAAAADDGTEGTIFTFWPLVDYRQSPKEGYSNLGILGPLIKIQHKGDDVDLAVRPLFYQTANEKNDTLARDYLYPLAASERAPETESFQFLKLFQSKTFRKNESEEREESSMLFPFYIRGESKKYGPYRSIFPLYGDIYERFWRDEYHFVLFPIYGRTVNRGTTSTNLLYPIFNFTSGENESGFSLWPLYGEAAKKGVYQRRFVLWPIYSSEEKGLDTDKPSSSLYLFPFYAATDTPTKRSRYYLWPFFGYASDSERNEEVRDYFWPFWWTVRGEKRNATSLLPFYSVDRSRQSMQRWILWPLYHYDEISSDTFRQERDRLLYFFFTDNREIWPNDGSVRRKTALWPLFIYRQETTGVKTLGIPAPIEPILDKEGIERSWAPFWRLYNHKWDDKGNSALSLFWNLYWHQTRGEELAYELFPLIFYRTEQKVTELSLMKGLINYRNRGGSKRLALFWLPFGIGWGEADVASTGLPAGSNK